MISDPTCPSMAWKSTTISEFTLNTDPFQNKLMSAAIVNVCQYIFLTFVREELKSLLLILEDGKSLTC